MKNDLKLMRLALSLAQRGYGTTSPNPMVGAVLVKGDMELARHHVFALVPLIFGMQDYYESDEEFKKMVQEKKKQVGG